MSDDGRVRVFGFEHADLDRIAVPYHAECLYCSESIERDDTGYSTIYLGEDVAYRVFYHFECFLRTLLGSAAHIERRCHCYIEGASEEDDPQLTRRQAAQAAVKAYRHGVRLTR